MLYHLSAEAGRTWFDPQPYWHLNYVQAGRVLPGRPVPEGAEIHVVFYASAMPKAAFYAAPRDARRLYITREEHGASLDRAAGVLGDLQRDRLLIFEQAERPRIENHEFSVYAFDPALFTELPSREYVSYQRVEPVSEARHRHAGRYLLAQGFEVRYVEDIWQVRAALAARDIRFDAEHLRRKESP